MPVDVKICGITTLTALSAAAVAGARYVGFVFYDRSPRVISVKDAALLAPQSTNGMQRVGLFVDPDDATLTATLEQVSLDAIQLHGDESPDRVAAVKSLTQKEVWKALPICDQQDIKHAQAYQPVADFLLFDAKPPKSMPRVLPGGNGLAFDWQLIAGTTWTKPWGLAGGLTPENVAEAIAVSGALMVDVSSGVETSPGVKDPDKIEAFVKAARNQTT